MTWRHSLLKHESKDLISIKNDFKMLKASGAFVGKQGKKLKDSIIKHPWIATGVIASLIATGGIATDFFVRKEDSLAKTTWNKVVWLKHTKNSLDVLGLWKNHCKCSDNFEENGKKSRKHLLWIIWGQFLANVPDRHNLSFSNHKQRPFEMPMIVQNLI